MGIAPAFKVWALLPCATLLLLAALPSTTWCKSYHCERGEQYLNHELQRCVDCTRCNATEGLIVLQPCDIHRDTVCGPISKLIEGIRIRHQSHHQHHAHHRHHGVPEAGDVERRRTDGGGDASDNGRPAPFSSMEAIVWDWQAIALTMAVFTCILFFVIITVYSMHQARQWRRLKENFDSDVEELSARLSLMAANSQEKGEVLEPTMGPIHDAKSLKNRCMYLEQLIQVRKEKDPNAETGNVYIEESPSSVSKPT